MAIVLAQAVVDLLNGASYYENEGGEVEVDRLDYRVIVSTTTPDNNLAGLFIADLTDIHSLPNGPIPFTALEVTRFIADQVQFLRQAANVGPAELSDEAAHEIAVFRLLAYRNRLAGSQLVNANHHVQYNNVHRSDPTTLNSVTHTLDNDANRAAFVNAAKAWLNANQNKVDHITHNFSNYVCLLAYMFRAKGHHYVTGSDYDETYTRLWSKVSAHVNPLASTWAQRYTLGLHSIMPDVLDAFWRWCARLSRIAAPLVLRLGVPAAGTAAPFALLVGWDDARNAYGRLLQADEGLYQDLVALVDVCRRHRWRHGINARYYGEDASRVQLQPFTPMAATVAGVYESVAEGATLLDSKSLQREARGSPLQRDIAGLAARALRGAFIKELTKPRQLALPQPR